MCAEVRKDSSHVGFAAGRPIYPKPAEELAEDSAVMKDANRALGLTNMENPCSIVTLPFRLYLMPRCRTWDWCR